MMLTISHIPSPIGDVVLATDDRALLALEFADDEDRLMRVLRRRFDAPQFREAADPLGAASALRAYFAGRLDAIEKLSADGGGTPFQRRVWKALRGIPVGTTVSYGDLARRIGAPTACRAVGLANGSNPISIVVPCHRVIGSNGTLTGYGGGLPRKRWLLEHEGALQRQAA